MCEYYKISFDETNINHEDMINKTVDAARKGAKIVLWGVHEEAGSFYNQLKERNVTISYFTGGAAFMYNSKFLGIPIVDLTELLSMDEEFVIVILKKSTNFDALIRHLAVYGYTRDRIILSSMRKRCQLILPKEVFSVGDDKGDISILIPSFLDISITLENIQNFKEADKKLVVYGVGECGDWVVRCLAANGIIPYAYVDSSINKQGNFYQEKIVQSPEILFEKKENYIVLISSEKFYCEIENYLLTNGFPREQIVSNLVHNVFDVEPVEYAKLSKELKMDELNPTVTILMYLYQTPIYYVKRAIYSVLNQTYTRFKLLIVDNHADTDNKKLIADLEKKDKRIQVIRLNRNTFESDDYQYKLSVDEKIRECITTEYYCGLDSDDYFDEKFLEKTMEAAEAYHADIVAVNSLWYEEDRPYIFSQSTNFTQKIVANSKSEIADAITENVVCFNACWAKLLKTEKFLYDGNVELGITILPRNIIKCNTLVVVPEILHFWTMRKNSFSAASNIYWSANGPERVEIFSSIYKAWYVCLEKLNGGRVSEKNLNCIKIWFINDLYYGVLIPLRQSIEDGLENEQIKAIALRALQNSMIQELVSIPGYDFIMNEFKQMIALE